MTENKKKIKVAVVKYGGICSGGTEKYIQTIAANLPKDRFEVDFYYCDGTPYIGADYKYPPSDPERLQYLLDHGVNAIKFDVDFKDVTVPTHTWVNTNFWDVFKEEDYDIVQTGRAGHSEYPFTEINNTWIVDAITLPGMAEFKSNVYKTIHISEYQKETWVKAGGHEDNAIVLPIVSDLPDRTTDDLRMELDLGDAFVCGLHQREDDGIFSPVALNAFARLAPENAKFIVMGGSKNYEKLAAKLGLEDRFIQLPHSGDPKRLDMFLNTLDVYTHARADGETFGLCISEAMAYGLPVVSHVAPAMGHVETIGAAGKVCETEDEYVDFINELRDNDDVALAYTSRAVERYNEKFAVDTVMDKIIEIYEAAHATKTLDSLSDDEFWEDVWEDE